MKKKKLGLVNNQRPMYTQPSQLPNNSYQKNEAIIKDCTFRHFKRVIKEIGFYSYLLKNDFSFPPFLEIVTRDELNHALDGPKETGLKLITVCINTLISFYLEPFIKDFIVLSQVGQTVFDRVGLELYKDTYKHIRDKVGEAEGIRPPRNEEEVVLFEEFLHAKGKGYQDSFDAFIASKNQTSQQPKRLSNNRFNILHKLFKLT